MLGNYASVSTLINDATMNDDVSDPNRNLEGN
jgi:hypothetical protein